MGIGSCANRLSELLSEGNNLLVILDQIFFRLRTVLIGRKHIAVISQRLDLQIVIEGRNREKLLIVHTANQSLKELSV